MSGLSFSGQGGEIRIGRKVQATLATFSKDRAQKLPTGQKVARVTFEVAHFDEYWTSYGPPTTVALPAPGRLVIYEVDSGDIRAGALVVKLPPRVEKR
jgi:hypothetical protein